MAAAKKSSQQGNRTGNPQGKKTSDNASSSSSGGGATTSKTAEERKAKREAARQERLEAARKREKAKKRKRMLIGGGAAVLVLALVVITIRNNANQEAAFLAAAEAAGCTDVVEYDSEGRDHVGQGEQQEYETNPPTSGPHFAQPAPWGSYRETVEPETLVHNLEHGGIVIHYKNLSDSEVDALDSLVDSYQNGVISNPNDSIDANVALASWTRAMECDEYSAEAIQGYIEQYCNQGPEKLTTCEN